MSSNSQKTIVSGTIGKISGKIKLFQWARDISCNEFHVRKLEDDRLCSRVRGQGTQPVSVKCILETASY
jgi:hypothetical protein